MNHQEIYQKLLDAANAYYNTDTKIMSDEEFDKLKDQYESVTKTKFQVGAEETNVSARASISHSYQNLAGTLDKVISPDELKVYLQDKPFKSLIASLKIDGHSITFEFVDGQLHKALTRGKAGVGRDVTNYFCKAFNQEFSDKIEMLHGMDCAIKFEAAVQYKNLDAMNKEQQTNYKNPRSAVSGIIKDDGVPLSKYLTLYPLEVRIKGSNITRAKELEIINSLIVKFPTIMGNANHQQFKNLQGFMDDYYPVVLAKRTGLPMMIDGIVVEVGDDNLRESLGYSDTNPNFAVALKLPYMEKATKLIDVFWDTSGNTGTYTPVANFEPVIINNATYKQVSIANYKRFMNMNLSIGDGLLFSLNNDVLGYVEKIGDALEPKIKLQAPTHCRYCNEPLVTDDVFLFCENQNCDLLKLGTLEQFFTKMDIKGTRRNTIDALYRAKLLIDIVDVLELPKRYEQIAALNGFGDSSANVIIVGIQKKLWVDGIYDYELLGSLNIPLIGRGRAKEMAKQVPIRKLIETGELLSFGMSGVSDAINASFVGAIENIRSVFAAFDLAGVKFNEYCFSKPAESYTIVVTGELNGMGRKEFKSMVEGMGHKFGSAVSKKTSYLVTNVPSSTTSKHKTARELGVKIVTELEILEILKGE